MDKQAVAQQFSLAASHYDEAAHLQRAVADQLLATVSYLPIATGATIADLGTGTGYCLPFLQSRFTPTELSALDLSAAMLAQAGQRVAHVNLIEGDLEQPAFAAQSLDLAVSSLAVQWLESPEPFIANIAKSLKSGGYLALATLGPKTLCELKQAWRQVDSGKTARRSGPASCQPRPRPTRVQLAANECRHWRRPGPCGIQRASAKGVPANDHRTGAGTPLA